MPLIHSQTPCTQSLKTVNKRNTNSVIEKVQERSLQSKKEIAQVDQDTIEKMSKQRRHVSPRCWIQHQENKKYESHIYIF